MYLPDSGERWQGTNILVGKTGLNQEIDRGAWDYQGRYNGGETISSLFILCDWLLATYMGPAFPQAHDEHSPPLKYWTSIPVINSLMSVFLSYITTSHPSHPHSVRGSCFGSSGRSLRYDLSFEAIASIYTVPSIARLDIKSIGRPWGSRVLWFPRFAVPGIPTLTICIQREEWSHGVLGSRGLSPGILH